MDFNDDKSELWVAVPDLDQVQIVDANLLQVTEAPILVGDFPTGVSLEIVSLDGVERAYVANEMGESYSVIDVDQKVLEATISLDPGTVPTDLAADPQGTFLLVVQSGLDRIDRFDVPANVLSDKSEADVNPKRVVIQRRAP